jgi:hypothetical protein
LFSQDFRFDWRFFSRLLREVTLLAEGQLPDTDSLLQQQEYTSKKVYKAN